MQWMALFAGGSLDQHMPDRCPTHADHANDSAHSIEPEFPGAWLLTGSVTSKHHQAVSDAGSLRIVARAHDGVIEAIDDPGRRFYRGVQWHPERTTNDPLGADIYRALIAAARGSSTTRIPSPL
jgi:putative glutamine amidotransferase